MLRQSRTRSKKRSAVEEVNRTRHRVGVLAKDPSLTEAELVQAQLKEIEVLKSRLCPRETMRLQLAQTVSSRRSWKL